MNTGTGLNVDSKGMGGFFFFNLILKVTYDGTVNTACRGITRIHRSPSRPRPSVRPTAVLINIHEHLIKGLVKASRQTVN